LSLVQFNAAAFALQPPAGSMPPPSASLGDRVFALLSWAEGTGGCGLERLQEVFQAVLEGKILDNYSSSQVRHNLPRSGVAKFVGRETELNTLHKKLQQSGRLNIAAIKGMGGIGKSELALQYAYRHRDLGSYPGGLCWLDLRSGDLGGQIVRFARNQLDLAIPDGLDTGDQLAYCWRNWPEQPGEVLLVYDNVREYGDVKLFLPPADPRFQVLITSRNRMGLPVETIEILVLDEKASLELLWELAGKKRVDNQQVEAEELFRQLGYLPLAIELVGRYLAKKPDLSLSKMLERLEEKGLSAKALSETEVGMTANRGVAAAFELSWQELDDKGQELGCLLSLFAEAPIPWEIVEECLSEWDAEDLEDLRDSQLCGLSFLERPEEGNYQLHPLIREYFAQKREQCAGVEGLKRIFCFTIVLEARGFSNIPTLQQCEEFAPMVPHLVEISSSLLDHVEDQDLVCVFFGIAWYYAGQGIFTQAEQWHSRCLNECKSRLGEEHPDTLTSMCSLAQTLKAQGDLAGARTLGEQVVEASRRVLGEKDPDTLTSMNNLADTLYSQGDLAGARTLQEKVLEARRKRLGEEHLSTLRIMNNLALTLKAQGDLPGAGSLLKLVLEVMRNKLGDKNQYTMTSMNNLANLLSAEGDLLGACNLHEKVFEGTCHELGDKHPITLTSMFNLANTLNLRGHCEQAEPLYVNAVEKGMEILGIEHPTTTLFQETYREFLSDIAQNKPEVLAKLLSNGSAMTKQILEQMQKDKELGNCTQEG
jgi:Tetratricopeptide repeat/NB-ARC domain